uniref:Pyruvate synthase n=1 Tax=Desulfobacca acetoxidans TaxID=60893 RepID=A0A7C3ZAZ4_9BACT
MKRTLMTGNGAAAWGARLAQVDYVPAFPITPQTEIIETIAHWIDAGEMDARMVTLESEHSMVTAAGAAAATGVRVFTATSSQGLLYAMEMLYTIAGWRVPLVLVNVSRGLSAPITLEPDHNDILAARDCGFLQIYCATCQEVLDSVLLAYRLAEDKRVRLPVIVNQDGFYLSFTREPVAIPDSEAVRRFLGPFEPGTIRFRASAPASQAVAVLGGSPYSYFRYEMHLAALNGLKVYDEIALEFARHFGRRHPMVEAYRTDDADLVLVMLGAFATKAREAVDRLRLAGWKIGLVRPRLLRPFPEARLRELLLGKKGAAVIDQNLSMGKGGVLYTEVAAALYGRKDAPLLASFVGGLGGRDITLEEFYEMARVIRDAAANGQTPPPRLLYTEAELREVRKLQAIALAERERLGHG